MCGNISQQRVSQLVRKGVLVVDRDTEGRLRYDRESVERYVAEQAARASLNDRTSDDRKALQAEARDRMKAAREKEAREKAEKEAARNDLLQRAVTALETIASAAKKVR